jgi:hypothetical protein
MSDQVTTAPDAARSGHGVRGTVARAASFVRARPVAAHLTLMGTLAFSAGVHAGLVAAHLRESPLLGTSFIASVIVLVAIAVALGLYPASVWPLRAAAANYFALILAYVTFTERIADPLGITTKVVEAFGMVLALLMQPAPELKAERRTFLPVYVLLVAFVVLVALHASRHHHH